MRSRNARNLDRDRAELPARSFGFRTDRGGTGSSLPRAEVPSAPLTLRVPSGCAPGAELHEAPRGAPWATNRWPHSSPSNTTAMRCTGWIGWCSAMDHPGSDGLPPRGVLLCTQHEAVPEIDRAPLSDLDAVRDSRGGVRIARVGDAWIRDGPARRAEAASCGAPTGLRNVQPELQ